MYVFNAWCTTIAVALPTFANAQLIESPNRVKQDLARPYASNEGNTLLRGVLEHYHFLYDFKLDPDDEQIRDKLPFKSIELHRSNCLGRCPEYFVQLTLDGESRYPRQAHKSY